MLVIIRVDSSSQIGSGHLMRCLTLAGQLKKQGAEIAFICRDIEGNLTELVKKKGYELYLLPCATKDDTLTGYATWLTVSQKRDAEETIAIIQKFSVVNRLVIDSYAIDETWEKLLRPYVQEIFVIDDLANRRHDCDVLLDQNYYLDKEHRYDGLLPESCKLLLGPEHALLREEFYEAKKHLRKRDGRIHNILVFYGGSDLTDETTKAIQALIELNLPGVTADVIVGTSINKKIRFVSFVISMRFCTIMNRLVIWQNS
jgi:UDP-2,4-diacetamido-2,4,6-trideoxy-beta-L-altropyranose hydrolase